MDQYTIYTVKYMNQPAKYDMKKLRYNDRTRAMSLIEARRIAYFMLNNARNGLGYIVIAKGNRLMGEVMHTVHGQTYWYPSNDGKYAAAGKYTLNANGSLGTKWR